jgi:hypothetical protein
MKKILKQIAKVLKYSRDIARKSIIWLLDKLSDWFYNASCRFALDYVMHIFLNRIGGILWKLQEKLSDKWKIDPFRPFSDHYTPWPPF